MANELQIRPGPALAPATEVKQYGPDATYIDNRGSLTIQYEANFGPTTMDALMAVQRFSREYYHLIVTTEDIMHQTKIIILADKAMVKGTIPDELFDRCATLTPEAQVEAMAIPAIICNMNTDYGGKTLPGQTAIYARLIRICPADDEIEVEFQPLGPVSQELLVSCHPAFGLNMSCAMTDLNITGWSIRKINLFEAFASAGISGLPMPT